MIVDTSQALSEQLERIRENFANAAHRAGRSPQDVTIVAVTKTVERSRVDAAFALGLRHFGENRVQEALAKYENPLPTGARLHLIGQLQTNKVKRAVECFDLIESVDRFSLLSVLEREAERIGRKIPVLLQVNVAREPQKAGCPPETAEMLMAQLADSPWLIPRGLMTIAPLVADPDEVRPVFTGLRVLRDQLQSKFPDLELSTLSMGMSDDYQVAIEEGATSVRLGRAIFGLRPAVNPA